ncbi:MAG TPA: PAS domain-containing protein, partial [Phenylobacterium sp.]|nr:PAS domain-containing protein [Phenylobacterium sp.]
MAVLHASKTAATAVTKGGLSGLGFATLPMPLAVLDGELTILEANDAFAELLDVPAVSLIGEPLGKRLRSAATDIPDGDGVQTFGFQCADGPRWLRLDLQEQGDRILAILLDVTGERTVLERMKADFAARGRL